METNSQRAIKLIDSFEKEHKRELSKASIKAGYAQNYLATLRSLARTKEIPEYCVKNVEFIIVNYTRGMTISKKLIFDTILNVIDEFEERYPGKCAKACEMAGKSRSYISSAKADALNGVHITMGRLIGVQKVINNYEKEMDNGNQI